MRFFDPDNELFRGLSKFTDLLVLSVLWTVCSIPVFTAGPATAALYHAVNKSFRENSRFGWSEFFRSFKMNFKVGAPASLITAAVLFVLVMLGDLLGVYAEAVEGGMVLYAAYCVLMLFPLGMVCYLFPALSRFEMGVGMLFTNCFKLALAHLPSTVAMALLLVAAVYVCTWLWIPVLLVPGLLALAHSLFLERIFRPYMSGSSPEEDE